MKAPSSSKSVYLMLTFTFLLTELNNTSKEILDAKIVKISIVIKRLIP